MTVSRREIANVAMFVLALTASGCSNTNTDDDATTTTPAAQVAEQLAGRYAHYDAVAYESSDMKTLIISYGFTDLSVKDGTLMAHESFCHAEHRSDQPIETTISDAATSAIKPIPVAVTLTTTDGVTRIKRPETPTGVGIHLDDPANDKLPTDPADPRVADDDHDGKPGITVHIKVNDAVQGDLYIARRERFAYEVTADGDVLTGEVTDKSEQLIVGASNPMFITNAPWTQVSDLSLSPIVLKKVDAKSDCAWLDAERTTLFGEPPEVAW